MSLRQVLWASLLLSLSICAHAQPQVIYCNAGNLTACITSFNAGSGATGDPAWKSFGKVNANFAALPAEFFTTLITTVPHGGTGVGTLTGFAFGNGTSAFSAASTAQLLTLLGNLPVSHLNSGTSAGSTTFWRGDGTWAVPAYPTVANPSASIGLSAVNGATGNFMDAGSAPALSQAISPTWSGTHTFSNAITVNGAGTSLKGGVTVTAPASGQAFTVTGSTGATDVGLRVNGGSNSGNFNTVWTNAGVSTNFGAVFGDGGFEFGGVGHDPGATNAYIDGALTIATGGSSFKGGVTITAAGSGNTLSAAGQIAFTGVTTGTNTNTVCMASGNVLTLQASTCTISSKRFKTNIELLRDASPVLKLQVHSFQMRENAIPNPDPNYGHKQYGLIAEEVAAVLPECALYERDMQTPKSYRPECITALLVKVSQDHQTVATRQQWEIYLLMAWCLALTLWRSGWVSRARDFW